MTRPHLKFVCLHFLQKICLLSAEFFQFSSQLTHFFSQLLWTYDGQGRESKRDRCQCKISFSFTHLGSGTSADISTGSISRSQGKSGESGNICSNVLLMQDMPLPDICEDCSSLPVPSPLQSSNLEQLSTITGLVD